MIKIRDLSIRRGEFSIENLNLDIGDGEYFVILGPTGSGKTLLMEAVAGLERPDRGRIFLDGRDATGLEPEERGIGYMPQDDVLFPFATVEENISFPIRKSPAGVRRERAREYAGMLSIDDLMERGIEGLSGGERQRVALARALIPERRILLLDEPFSALDVGLRQKLWFEIGEAARTAGATVLHVTHDLEEAFTLSGRLGVLAGGRLVQVGSRDEIIHRPATEEVAAFLGLRNIFGGFVEGSDGEKVLIRCGSMLITAPGNRPFRGGEKVRFCVRPEEIKVIRSGKDLRADLAENLIEGRIVRAVPHGLTLTAYFRADEGRISEGPYDLEIRLPAYTWEKLNLNEGARIRVSVRMPAIHILA